MSNILIGCDQNYFDTWGIPLLSSIRYRAPWVHLHCHIVNPMKKNDMNGVSITEEYIEFPNNNVKIAYLQAVRFLVVADKFTQNENVITLDADTICAREFVSEEFSSLFEKQYVLQHRKALRWLAGLVVFFNNGFREEYARRIRQIPIAEWQFGRDQLILKELESDFRFEPLPYAWMSVGKRSNDSVFLTLKGEQKYTDKYLSTYARYKID